MVLQVSQQNMSSHTANVMHTGQLVII